MLSNFIKFVRDHYDEYEGTIQLHAPKFIGNEKIYIEDCIDSTFVSSVGEYVNSFERIMSQITDTKKCVAVVNGTAALEVALRLVGVKNGDEVITQALTFVATANAISFNNATPIFLDVDVDTMGLSPISVSNFLHEFGEMREGVCFNKKTNKPISACVPMHTFGFPVKIDELIKVCKPWNIPIVEDAAESLGSKYKGKQTGSFGNIGAFSFNGNKIITSGGGGAITTNNIKLGEKAKFLTTTAKKPHPFEYYHSEVGYNYRMPNLNAALACAQLEKLDLFIKEKRILAKKYENLFSGIGIKFRKEMKNTNANYWLMCIELDNLKDRDLFLENTNSRGIITRPIWKPMDLLPMYKHCQKDSLNNTRFLEQRIVNIPSSVK